MSIFRSTGWLALAAAAAVTTGSTAQAARTVSVRDCGAVGDGKTLDTRAINDAVALCARSGGGRVVFPPGVYLSGTVLLKSNVLLELRRGATLRGSADLSQYRHFTPPPGTPESGWTTWHRALVLAVEAHDIGVVGGGIVDGAKVFDAKGEEGMRGPHTILCGLSQRITIQGVTIRDSANYAVMLEDCSDVAVRRTTFDGGWDGVHFRGWPGRPCQRVRIADCVFRTGDDSIAGRYWEDVVVERCRVNSSCNGVRLIGPAVGLTIRNCRFDGPGLQPHRTSGRHNMLAGINLQPGGWDPTEGDLEGVVIRDVTMRDVSTPFHFVLKAGNRAGRIEVSRVRVEGAYLAASSIESWAETPIRELVMRDVQVEHAGGGGEVEAAMIVRSPGVDARPLPAWGVYLRNVGRALLENVRLSTRRPDRRSPIVRVRVPDLELRDVTANGQPIGAVGNAVR